jgi:hypothetical protein
MEYRITENKVYSKGKLTKTFFSVEEKNVIFFGLFSFWKLVKYKKTRKSKWTQANFDFLEDAKRVQSILERKYPFTGTTKKVVEN